MIVAGIDCGTNSIRLLIAEETPEGTLREVERRTTIVRLGQDVDRTGEFAPEALERTFGAVDLYADALAARGAEHIVFGATSATRDASNREAFMTGIRQRLGIEPRVISGDQEALLSFTGATVDARDDARTLVVDLGGGSTEFVVGRCENGQVRLEGAKSTDMGSVRFTERFLRSDPPTEEEMSAAREEIRRKIAEAETEVNLSGLDRVVGVAGTITTIFAMALGLSRYDRQAIHGQEVPISLLRSTAMQLVTADRETKTAIPVLHPGRVDVIGAGALIVDSILERLSEANPHLTTMAVSETDILDGLTMLALREARGHMSQNG